MYRSSQSLYKILWPYPRVQTTVPDPAAFWIHNFFSLSLDPDPDEDPDPILFQIPPYNDSKIIINVPLVSLCSTCQREKV
jgi:hypothetical protein